MERATYLLDVRGKIHQILMANDPPLYKISKKIQMRNLVDFANDPPLYIATIYKILNFA